MDIIHADAVDILSKLDEKYEIEFLKTELNSILTKITSIIENSAAQLDYRIFDILNKLVIQHRDIVSCNLDILINTTTSLFSMLRLNEKKIPALARTWIYKCLRHLLVVDPDMRTDLEIKITKKMFLMGYPLRKYRFKQIEIGLKELKEKIIVFASVKDTKLLESSLIAFTAFFKVDPIFSISGAVQQATSEILLALNHYEMLPDEFVTKLITEHNSFYYISLSNEMKFYLCKHFIDIFEFHLVNMYTDPFPNLKSDWFTDWIAKDLSIYKHFISFKKSGNGQQNATLTHFLERFDKEIVEIGRLRGYHSNSTYKKVTLD